MSDRTVSSIRRWWIERAVREYALLARLWIVPKVKVEVVYPNKRADGRLRHPAFKGLQGDLTK